MRILILSWEYPPRIIGGISRVVYHLARELGRLGNEVSVITVKDNDAQMYETCENVSVYRVEPYMVEPLNFIDSVLQMNYSMVEKAVDLINRGKAFDIIHLHDWMVAYAGSVLKGIYSDLPSISTFHSTECGRNIGIHDCIQHYISNIESFLAKLSRKVIVNSSYMKDEIINQFEVPESDISVIPNGIDVDKFNGITFDSAVRRQFCSDGEKLVLFVGRLVNGKGIYVLLDAIPKVLERMPSAKFVIAGTGAELEGIREKASKMGISDKVSFPGFISEEMLLKLYKCSDVAVFPSLYEPFGIVALEGMVARIPIVVSDTGGFSQIINHRVNGMKFEVGNSTELAGCIVELLSSPMLVESITENAFSSLSRFYQWDDIAEKTLEVYREVINTHLL